MSLVTGASSLSLAAFGLLIAGFEIPISISIHIWFIASAAFPLGHLLFQFFCASCCHIHLGHFQFEFICVISFALVPAVIKLTTYIGLHCINFAASCCGIVIYSFCRWAYHLGVVAGFGFVVGLADLNGFERSPLLTPRGPFILSCWFTALYLLSFTWPRTLDCGFSTLRFIFGYFLAASAGELIIW